MSIDLHFSTDDWDRIKRDWTAWWAGELERPMVVFPAADPVFGISKTAMTRQFLLETPVDEVMEFFRQRLERAIYYGDSWPKWFPYFGPGIMTGFLGGKVEPQPEQRTVWFEADKPIPYEELHFSFDEKNIWWQRVYQLTKRTTELWENQVNIGFTDIGGILDILASFRKSSVLLTDLYEYPDEVIRCAAELRTLWIKYFHELSRIIAGNATGTSNWAPIWSPKPTYMHQCDFSYMLSPKMFERFVLPDLDICFREVEHSFYHLDGKGQIPHLDMLLSLKSLRGVQWVPGAGQPSTANWLPLLKRIRDAGKLCQVFVDAKDCLQITRELGGKGFAFCIFDRLNPEEIVDFLNTMKSIGRAD